MVLSHLPVPCPMQSTAEVQPLQQLVRMVPENTIGA